jgi:eukaryotic-like serine/threonine-protein kinase
MNRSAEKPAARLDFPHHRRRGILGLGVANPEVVGRYVLCRRIAAGGMATIHLGRLMGPVGFSRTVAIKRMQPGFTENPEIVAMFLDEARLAARIRHPNVVATLDVVTTSEEVFLVLEYVHGETLARLVKLAGALGEQIPVSIAAAIASGGLHGLHAAHEARNERGDPLGIVHRDVSPQNIMVGVDGVARVLDFGIAKAIGRLHTTREGLIKGKLAYMAPEQIRGEPVTRRSDVYAMSVVLWEALTGLRLFSAENEGALLDRVLTAPVKPPSKFASGVPRSLDRIVLRGLSRDPNERFATARAMADAIHEAIAIAVNPVVGDWVGRVAAEPIARQAGWVAEIESGSQVTISGSTPPVPERASAAIEPKSETTDIATSVVTMISQPSSISVATPSRGSPPVQRRRRWLAAVLALGASASVLGFLAFHWVTMRKVEASNPTVPAAEASSPGLAIHAPLSPEPSSTQIPPAASETGAEPSASAPVPSVEHRETHPSTVSPPATRRDSGTSGYDPYEHL